MSAQQQHDSKLIFFSLANAKRARIFIIFQIYSFSIALGIKRPHPFHFSFSNSYFSNSNSNSEPLRRLWALGRISIFILMRKFHIFHLIFKRTIAPAALPWYVHSARWHFGQRKQKNRHANDRVRLISSYGRLAFSMSSVVRWVANP